MRVVFMGTPEFAVPSLRALASIAEVVAVYSRPDAVSGRGRSTRPSPVAVEAESLGMPVRKPATLKSDEVLAELLSLDADILIVAAYGMILPPAVLASAKLGAVNVHASLLPRWRGAAPIQRAILAGDVQVGVSIMRMEAGLDTGPYCLQRGIPVDDGDAVSLTEALAHLGAEALVDALPGIADGTVVWTDQDEALVTYADKISKADVAIAPDMPAEGVVRHVRASSPAAPCRMTLAGRGVTLLAASAPDSQAELPTAPGSVAANKFGVVLGASDGPVLVARLKPDGKGAMNAADWARGVHDLHSHPWNGH